VAWKAAQLAAGDDHLLAGLTAGGVWEMKGYPDADDIELVTASKSRSRLEGVRTRRTLWLPEHHITERRKLPVTSPARTLLDTATRVDFRTLKAAANDLLRRDVMRTSDLERLVRELPRKTCGGGPMHALAAIIVPGYHPGESEPELDIVATLVAGGFPKPEQQIWGRGPGWRYRIDVGYRDLKHGFEYQSEQEHLNRAAFHADSQRTNRLQQAGWTIWPMTSQTRADDLLGVAAMIFGHEGGLCRPS